MKEQSPGTALEILRTIEANAQRALREARDKRSALEDKLRLPELKRQYEGKYFKFLNSYGSDRPKWWLYRKVLKVLESGHAITFEFQDDTDGRITFKRDPFAFLTGYVPCTEREFNAAHKRTLKKLARP